VDERRARRVLGVIDTVRPELSTKAGVGPGEVGRVGSLLVLGRHEADELERRGSLASAVFWNQGDRRHMTHLVALGLVVRLEVTVLDEPVAHLRVIPARPDGGLGASVVLVEKLLVLVLGELGGIGAAERSSLAVIRAVHRR
jgi:hypothetical protein